MDFESGYKLYMSSGAYLYNNPAMVPGISKAVVEEDLYKLVMLVESGQELDAFDYFGNGPLHIAVIKDNGPILDFLLSKSTEYLDEQNFLGETPLLKALSMKRFDLAEKLIHAGADVNIPDDYDVTPLHMVVRQSGLAHILIEYGADLELTDTYDQTPLHYAVEQHCLETVCLLLYFNADATVTDAANYTPFMKAVELKDVCIQEALFEYVDDFDTVTSCKNLSVLGLALVHDSPFAQEMIKRGADVNKVNHQVNGAFFLTLHYSRINGRFNMNTFRLVWERLKYEPTEEISVLGSLKHLEGVTFQGVLEVLLSTNKFAVIAESLTQADDFAPFIMKCIWQQVSLETFTMLCSGLLSYGYCPAEIDLALVFNHWGYCEIFEVLMHMDIRESPSLALADKIPAQLIYGVKYSVTELLDRLVDLVEKEGEHLEGRFALVMVRVLDHWVYPPLIKAYLNLRKTDCATLKIQALPNVPSIMEMARNKTRENVKATYTVSRPCELLALLQNMDVSETYKKILVYKTVTYRPVFTDVGFKRYYKMLKMSQVSNEILNPIVASVLKNSIIF